MTTPIYSQDYASALKKKKSHQFSPDMALIIYKAWNKAKKFNSFTANCHEQTPDQTHFSTSCIKNTIDVLIML